MLFVGRLSLEKGLDVLLRALALVGDSLPGLTVDVVGGGDQERALRALSKELGLQGVVTFHGAISGADLEGFYRGASALVVPSRCMETGPLVALEAMAHGVPVVGSERGGLAELVQPGRNGLLFRPEDPSDLAEAISRLIGDGALRRSLSEGGLRLARERYSTEAHMERLEETYSAVLAASATSPLPLRSVEKPWA